jgi:hypothetical protein
MEKGDKVESSDERLIHSLRITYLIENHRIDGVSRLDFEEIGSLITQHAGEDFKTRNGKTFAYAVDRDKSCVNPNRTALRIPQGHFKRYFEFAEDKGPISGPGGFRKAGFIDIQGPSYLWAIMHDKRIMPGSWQDKEDWSSGE